MLLLPWLNSNAISFASGLELSDLRRKHSCSTFFGPKTPCFSRVPSLSRILERFLKAILFLDESTLKDRSRIKPFVIRLPETPAVEQDFEKLREEIPPGAIGRNFDLSRGKFFQH
jgi:hypothetical protein